MRLEDADILIDRFESCESAIEVGEVFCAAIRTYGFVATSAGECRATPQGPKWTFFFNTWPPEWLEEYQRRNFVRVDPLPVLAQLVDRPFTWLEALAIVPESPDLKAFRDWTASIGLLDGLAVPHHVAGNDMGLCVTLADREMSDAAERRALHLASLYALQRCRSLGGASFAPTSPKSPLSERETACMRWVLEGKSDRDIGDILKISPATVHFHVEQIKRKLGVRTRQQAARVVTSLGYA